MVSSNRFLSLILSLILKSPALIAGLFFIYLSLEVYTPIRFGGAQRKLLPPPPQLHHFAFGYQEPLSDLLWLRAIQDFDFCENQIAKNTCENNSWLYKILDAATNLSPKYRIVYRSGALALSVIVSDIGGASMLYDKGVAQFPNDWTILYRGGYHALMEEKNEAKAAERMQAAAKNGAPEWVYNLAARLYTRSGKQELAQHLYEELKEQGFSPQLLERMHEQIQDKLKE